MTVKVVNIQSNGEIIDHAGKCAIYVVEGNLKISNLKSFDMNQNQDTNYDRLTSISYFVTSVLVQKELHCV